MKLLILSAAIVCLAFGDDLTIQEKAIGSEVVEAVIDILDEACVFSDNKQMLRRIAKIETNDGEAENTFEENGQPVEGGIWKVDENKLQNISTRTDLFEAIKSAFDIDWSAVVIKDMRMPLYSGLAARMWIDTQPTKGYEVPWSEIEQANYWVTQYHSTGSMSVDDYITAIASLEETCDSEKADLVFVLDGSGSIGASNFDTMKDFVVSVIDSFDVKDDGVQVGLIKYSANSKTEFYLGEITDKQQAKTEAQRITYEQGGTNTAAGLDDLRMMFAQYGRGSGVPQISIVMTDGQSNDQAATAVAAQKVHDEKLTVFAVGVTSGVNMVELETIGTDPNCIHVSVLNSFQDISPFTSKIQRQACKSPAEMVPDEEYEGSCTTGKRVFFKLKIKKNKKGVTIKIKMRSGATRLYVSFKARNPGRAIFKYTLRVDSSNRDGGRMYIPFPEGYNSDETDLFAALMGDGFGQQNLYNIGTNDGDSGAAISRPAYIVMLLAAVMAFFVNK